MGANYDVGSITRTVDITPGTPAGYVYEIRFDTKPHGIRGAVTVPVAGYTAEIGVAAIIDAANELERTFQL